MSAKWPYRVTVTGTDGVTSWQNDYAEPLAAEFSARHRSKADGVESASVTITFRDGEPIDGEPIPVPGTEDSEGGAP